MSFRVLASTAALLAFFAVQPSVVRADDGPPSKCVERRCLCPGDSSYTGGSCDSTCEQICGITNNVPSQPSRPPGSVACGGGWCPAGTRCRNGNTCPDADSIDCGSGTCPAGDRCGGNGACLPPGAVECGRGFCDQGQSCSSSGGCLQPGSVECASGGSCRAGFFCGSHGRCTPEGNVVCGNGSCRPGTHCSSSSRCIKDGNMECGQGSCGPDSFCGSQDRCMKNLYTDCGNGTSCSPGFRCGGGGGCVAESSQECRGGGSCPAGTKCSVSYHACIRTAFKVPAEQIEVRDEYYNARQMEKAAEYLADMKRIRTYQDDLKAALNIITIPWMCRVSITGLEQRKQVLERTRKHLLDLQKKILKLAIERMTDDTKSLVPYKWDSDAQAAEKRAVAEAMGRQIQAMWATAGQELDPTSAYQEVETPDSKPKNILTRQFGDGEKAYLRFTPGPALIRLEEIRRNGQYWD